MTSRAKHKLGGGYVTYIHLNPGSGIQPGSSTTYIHLAGGGPPPHQLPTAEADILSQTAITQITVYGKREIRLPRWELVGGGYVTYI